MKSWFGRLEGQRFELADAALALASIGGQIAHKRKVLAIESAGCQCQQQRHRTDQRRHPDAQVMGSAHHR